MTSDLPKRLRAVSVQRHILEGRCYEAADEIERLTTERDNLSKAYGLLNRELEQAKKEIDSLGAQQWLDGEKYAVLTCELATAKTDIETITRTNAELATELEECRKERDHAEMLASNSPNALKAQAGEPVGYFIDSSADGSQWPQYEQVSNDYKDDRDVFPLYRTTPTTPAAEPVMWQHPMDIRRNATGTLTQVSDEQVPLYLDASKYGGDERRHIICLCPDCVKPAAERRVPDYIELLKEAEQIVKSKPTWKRFIDGTPLANDIAVWMADFAILAVAPTPGEK